MIRLYVESVCVCTCITYSMFSTDLFIDISYENEK